MAHWESIWMVLTLKKKWSYRSSVLGRVLYLRHTQANIQFATCQYAGFTSNPKHSLKVALKQIGQYLIATRNCTLILKPNNDL
jgi:hypothetical protein